MAPRRSREMKQEPMSEDEDERLENESDPGGEEEQARVRRSKKRREEQAERRREGTVNQQLDILSALSTNNFTY